MKRVKIKELCGKHVIRILMLTWKKYTELTILWERAFEVVFVALGKNEDVSFSRVPSWLAIPHKDQKARGTKFAIPFPTSARAVLFAPDGRHCLCLKTVDLTSAITVRSPRLSLHQAKE